MREPTIRTGAERQLSKVRNISSYSQQARKRMRVLTRLGFLKAAVACSDARANAQLERLALVCSIRQLVALEYFFSKEKNDEW
jgi:hypothetical protein